MLGSPEVLTQGDGLPAVRRMYNLYHPFDPVGYRVRVSIPSVKPSGIAKHSYLSTLPPWIILKTLTSLLIMLLSTPVAVCPHPGIPYCAMVYRDALHGHERACPARNTSLALAHILKLHRNEPQGGTAGDAARRAAAPSLCSVRQGRPAPGRGPAGELGVICCAGLLASASGHALSTLSRRNRCSHHPRLQ